MSIGIKSTYKKHEKLFINIYTFLIQAHNTIIPNQANQIEYAKYLQPEEVNRVDVLWRMSFL